MSGGKEGADGNRLLDMAVATPVDSSGTGGGESSSRAGLLDDIFGERYENTLGGCVIGSVHDLIDAPESQQEAIERAGKHDFAALVTADTMAMIPKFRGLTAGLARSTLLVDPHAGFGDGVGSFALNFAEGVALNKVGRSMLPGSGLQTFTASRLGGGLAAESATHLTAGFGFGAVKAGFDSQSWIDESGNVSLTQGAGSIATAGTVGALINLPGGLVGMRAANLTNSALRRSAVSPAAASLIVGGTSGYTSGAVVGGIEAVKQGKSFGESLSLINTSGMIGAVTGTAMMAGSHFRERPGLLRDAAEYTRSRSLAFEEVGARSFKTKRTVEDGLEPVGLDRLGPPPGRIRFTELNSRLGRGVTETELFLYKPEGVKGPYESKEKFFDFLKFRTEKVVAYDVEGHNARILVKDRPGGKVTGQMETLRQLRLAADTEVPYDRLDFGQRSKIATEWGRTSDRMALLTEYMPVADAEASLPVVAARLKLLSHPDRNLALPEDMIAVLDDLPNANFVKDIVISDEPYIGDLWNKQFYGKSFETAATAGSDGRITYYRPRVDIVDGVDRSVILEFGKHEWTHLSGGKSPGHENLARLANLVDKDVPVTETAASENGGKDFYPASKGAATDKYYVRSYARTEPGEDFAVHMGEEFLSSDVDNFYNLAENAPVRAAVYAKNLSWALGQPLAGSRSSLGSMYSHRVEYVQRNVLPEAVKILENRLASGTPAEKAAAAELLVQFGDPELHTASLIKLATDPSLAVAPEAVPALKGAGFGQEGSKVKLTTLQDIAFDAAYRLNARNYGHDGFDFLLDQGRPDSPVRELARDRIRLQHGRNADVYERFLDLRGDRDGLPELMELIDRMPDARGRRLVFDEVLDVASGAEYGDGFKTAFLGRALRHPSLQMLAMENLSLKQSLDLDHMLGNLTLSRDRAIAGKAQNLLDVVRHEKLVTRLGSLLTSKSPSQMAEGVILASGVKDDRLVEPLLQVVLGGPHSVQSPALKALELYSPEVVKFHLRSIGQNATEHQRFARSGRMKEIE